MGIRTLFGANDRQTDTGEVATGASDRARRERRPLIRPTWSWLPAVVVTILSLVALYVGLRFVDRAGEGKPFTDLEQTFFGVYTLLVGAGVSWITTHYYAKKETEQRFMQLARPALRRVVAAKESAEGVLGAIARRSEALDDTEPFDSLTELVEQHARVLDDAIADWRELLPDEVDQAQQLVVEAALMRAQLSGLTEKLDALEAAGAADVPTDEVVALRKDMERLRAEVRARPSYSSYIASPNVGVGGGTGLTLTGGILAADGIAPKDGHVILTGIDRG